MSKDNALCSILLISYGRFFPLCLIFSELQNYPPLYSILMNSFHRIIYNAIESLVSPLNNNKVGQVFDNVIQVSLTVTISIHFLQNIQLTTSMDYNWH